MSDRTTLPCGCVLDTVDDTFTIQPCSADCKWLRYAVEESKRQGMATTALADPEASPEAVNMVEKLLKEAGF